MNYSKIYNALIKHRKDVPVDMSKYYEVHHIVPRSLNGTDEQDNLVVLTAREHFIAHCLLEKIVKEKYGEQSKEHGKMLAAIFFMSNDKRHRITSRKYERLRIEYSKWQSMKNTGKGNPMFGKNYQAYGIIEYTKQRKGKSDAEVYGKERAKEIAYKKGEHFRGKHFSDEHKKKLSIANKGHNIKDSMTDEQILQWKAKLSKARKGIKKSEEHKRKIGEANKGKKRTPEMKQHLRNIMLGRKATLEARKKMSEAGKGRKFTEEHKRKISENNCMHGHSVTDYMTEEEVKLWKEHISKASKGRKKMIHPITGDKKFPKEEDCQKYLDMGYIFGVKI